MMWLARLYISEAEAWQRRLTDVYAWHKAVWHCFPGREDARRDFLTRLDRGAGRFRLFLLAATEPRRPDWCAAPNWDVKPVAPSFLDHDRYRFDLVANPARKIHAFGSDGERKKNSRRVPLLAPEAQFAWLRRKGEAGGFAPLDEFPVGLSPAETHIFSKNSQRGQHVGVRFQGALRVTDRQAFRQSFVQGIGSARAFGFGLLMLSPLTFA